jgi:preprotein translocase subunit SecD
VRRTAAFPLLLACLIAAPAAPAGGEAPGRGLRIGAIQLCRDAIASAVGAADSAGNPIVDLILRPQWRALLERETGRLVGKRMPVRLDGRLVAEPYVREPITGGVVRLAGLSRRDAAAVEAAARRRC